MQTRTRHSRNLNIVALSSINSGLTSVKQEILRKQRHTHKNKCYK